MDQEKLISSPRLQELLTKIDPHERLDPAVEKVFFILNIIYLAFIRSC